MVSSNLSAEAEAPADRRASVRQVSDWEGQCERLSGRSDESWWFARVRDQSALGVGLVVRCRFDPGTVLLVELTSPDRRQTQTFRARVVHTTPVVNGWLHGCTLADVLSEAR